ncbi:hypothetical protein PUN28_005725 [Cardiocondyla obscurior]|uniref:Uncharacterized protein n=1 Tax=Cardiocondyla obscurior TaxID=286306 RepID=A0AAW2GA54_9HYME
MYDDPICSTSSKLREHKILETN